jgi:NADPH:quinone reductase-like Zn-dependent oxidoreductase
MARRTNTPAEIASRVASRRGQDAARSRGQGRGVARPIGSLATKRARPPRSGKAKRGRVSYSFVFMRANGEQLREITSLIESEMIRPVMDRVFPFEGTNDALAYIETGRSKGKVVVKVK